jgi:hypothetical protein
MTFMNPLMLFGVLGIALPILAHLLNKHKYKETDWAAMQFLNRNVRVRSRQLRLKDLFLLILRCLAILLLILALSRPTSNNPEGSWLSGEKRTGVVIAIDASYSMEHSDGKSTRFQRAIEKVDAIAETIHLGDPVSLVLLGSEHKVVVRNMAFDPNRFKTILQEQKASPQSLDLDSVPEHLKELAEDMDAPQKEIYILTDSQTQDWSQNASRLNKALKDLGESASVFVVPVIGGADNLAVTDLDLVSGVLRKGTVARYQATVKNCGPATVSNVEVKCRADGVQIDSKRIPLIQPGSSETVSLFVPFHNAGATRITAEINGDSLKTDNVRRVVAVVRDRVSVLCVDGTSGEAGGLIVAALLARYNGVEHKDYVVRSIPWLSFPTQDLEQVDVIVMANVPELTTDQAKKLSRHVRQGNGLVWFGGDSVKASKWNQQSKAGPTQLLPAVIGQVIETSDALGAGTPIDLSMPDHFVLRPLQSLPEDLLTNARFLKRLQVEPTAASIPLLKLAGSESPILLEHSLGRGHVFMFTTSADSSWNNMALNPVFPMLMQQLVNYLAGREFEQARIVGDSLALSYTDQPDVLDAVFDTPSEKTITVPVREYRKQYVALLENTEEAGFYVVKVSVQAAGMPVAVNVDTRESDISSLPEADLKINLKGTGVTIASTEPDLLAAIETSRTGQSFWRIFMIAALVLLLIESLYADRLLSKTGSSQQQTDPSAANMEAS